MLLAGGGSVAGACRDPMGHLQCSALPLDCRIPSVRAAAKPGNMDPPQRCWTMLQVSFDDFLLGE